ncbi:MAG: ShlB/FhaC/HecB family hemolysin secretion/activation protein [Cyanobacteria bacterium P01_E01_bin.35]
MIEQDYLVFRYLLSMMIQRLFPLMMIEPDKSTECVSLAMTSLCSLKVSQLPSIKSIRGLGSYGIWVLIACLGSKPAIAQNFEPLNPEPSTPNQPQPLPTRDNPLDDSLPIPPLPESVLDIPGTITVEQFGFVGSTIFSPTELNEAVAEFTGKPISFAQLIEAANAITELYVSQGYITSGAYIPAQSLDGSTVQIQVLEGSLKEIEVTVLQGRLNESYIRNRLEKKTSTPLNINQLQSALQLLQINPLIKSLNAELAAGIEPGTNLLTVSVIPADTFSLEINLNNDRNISIGTFERGIRLEEGNLFGIGDQFRLIYDNTDGSNQFGGGFTLPVNSRDGSLSFDFRLAFNEIVQPSFEDLDLDIESRNYDLTLRQPILQRATPEVSQELALSLTATRRESEGTIMDEPQPLTPGADENGELDTSVLSIAQEYLQRNRQQVFSVRSQFNFGLDLLDSTILEEEPDSEFFSWRGQFSYLRLLNSPEETSVIGSSILLRSELQLAVDPLISTEQFSLGGINTVRGFRQDALLTDNGFLAAAEVRLPVARFSKLNATLQLAPFIDFGTGWNADNKDADFNTLIGTGFGLLLQTPESLSARIDWGIPLINGTDEGSSLQEDGIYFQFQYDLF